MKLAKFEEKIWALMGNPSSKSDLFPHDTYDKKTGIFFNKDGSAGFVLETNPVTGASENLFKQFELLFNEQQPKNSFLQFTLIGDGDIEQVTDGWIANYSKASDVLRSMAKKRVQYLKQIAEYSDHDFTVKNYRLFISFLTKKVDFQDSLSEINSFREQVESTLKSSGMYSLRLSAYDLIYITTQIIAPSRSPGKYSPYESISNQIARSLPLRFEKNRIVHVDDFVSNVYSFDSTPRNFSINNMIGLLGENSAEGQAIPGRLILNYMISNEINEGRQSIMKNKGEAVIKNADSFFAKFDPSKRRESEAWRSAISELDLGKKLVKTAFTILLTAKENNFVKAERQLTSLCALNDFKIQSEELLWLPIFITSLPLGGTEGNFNKLKTHSIAHTTLSSEPLALLPIHADWRGNSTGSGMLMVGRRGQICNWNPFNSKTNPNVCIIGESGSGKSSFMLDLVTNLLADGVKVTIIDTGESYKNLCSLVGGEFIEFRYDSNICLNPFTFAPKDSSDEISQFLALTESIIQKMSSDKDELNKIEKAILSKALRDAFEEKLNDTKIDDICKKLEQEGSKEAKYLSKTLFNFTTKGNFGRFFNGKANINFKKQLTVIELGAIKKMEELLAVVMQTASLQIITQILMGDKKTKSAVVVDEGKFVLTTLPVFFSDVYEQIRKLNGMCILATQAIDHFFISEAAKSILKSAYWRITLQQNASAVDSALAAIDKGTGEYGISEREAYLMKSVRMVEGKYSEFLISSAEGFSVHRLVLDPYSRVLYSTTPSVFTAVQEYTMFGLGVDQAVMAVMEKMGY